MRTLCDNQGPLSAPGVVGGVAADPGKQGLHAFTAHCTQFMLRLFWQRRRVGIRPGLQDWGHITRSTRNIRGSCQRQLLLLQPSRESRGLSTALLLAAAVGGEGDSASHMRTDPAMIVAWPMAFLGPGQTLLAMPSKLPMRIYYSTGEG